METPAISDPHGVIMTLVSISVVFASLMILYIAYTIIGRLAGNRPRRKPETSELPSGEDSAEIAAAIGMALHRHLEETVHDEESYVITIKRKQPL